MLIFILGGGGLLEFGLPLLVFTLKKDVASYSDAGITS